MNLAEEFVLLAYADDGTPELDATRLDHGLGGALLLDLALAGRVEIQDKHVVVRGEHSPADPLLEASASRIASAPEPRTPGDWVRTFSDGTRDQILDRLVERGYLTREKDRVLWVFPRTRYPTPTGAETAAETDARRRLRDAVLASGPVAPRTAALCALVAATDLDRVVLADLDRERVETRLKEIGEGAWAADAVKRTVEDIETAVMLVVTTTTMP